MQLGMIGLGKMGAGMAQRLLEQGIEVAGYDQNEDATAALTGAGGQGVDSVEALTAAVDRPRILWMMVPAGEAVEETIQSCRPLLEEGDILVDGGNSNYRVSMQRAERLKAHGIGFVDVGVSGGVWGEDSGYCLMVGGEPQDVQRIEPILVALSPAVGQPSATARDSRPDGPRSAVPGYAHAGPPGAGHFIKMIHNGIEYGIMEAYAEGFELMANHPDFDLDLSQISDLWMHGSVIRSWLLELISRAFEEEGNDLATIAGWVPDSGEGRWAVIESIEQNVPAPVLALALQQRFRSRQEEAFAAKLVAAMRKQFGGHAVKRVEE